jgi:hypothetical protein
MFCHKCGAEIELKNKPGRQDYCPKCDAALHCCMNCRFYSPGAYHDCKETETEWVSDKAGPNFCDYFSASEKKSSISVKPDGAKAKLDKWFKK